MHIIRQDFEISIISLKKFFYVISFDDAATVVIFDAVDYNVIGMN